MLRSAASPAFPSAAGLCLSCGAAQRSRSTSCVVHQPTSVAHAFRTLPNRRPNEHSQARETFPQYNRYRRQQHRRCARTWPCLLVATLSPWRIRRLPLVTSRKACTHINEPTPAAASTSLLTAQPTTLARFRGLSPSHAGASYRNVLPRTRAYVRLPRARSGKRADMQGVPSGLGLATADRRASTQASKLLLLTTRTAVELPR